jgi:hypothetical protein
METDELISVLARTSAPVRPLASPWLRATVWLALSLVYAALVTLMMGVRPDLLAMVGDSRFDFEQGAALATGVAAAVAAFAATIPGYDRRVLLAPLLPLAIWLGSLGQGCLSTWMTQGAVGLELRSDWLCLPAIVVAGAVPAIAIVLMLRRGAPLLPHTTIALAGLAASGIGNFALRFFHAEDASVMVLVWQFGTVVFLTCVSGALGRYVLGWRTVGFDQARAD